MILACMAGCAAPNYPVRIWCCSQAILSGLIAVSNKEILPPSEYGLILDAASDHLHTATVEVRISTHTHTYTRTLTLQSCARTPSLGPSFTL